MADPVSVVGATITVLGAAVKAQKSLSKIFEAYDYKRFKLDVEVSLEKYRVWQDRWAGEEAKTSASSEALWGTQGWDNLCKMLDSINDLSSRINDILKELESAESHPKSKWRVAISKIRRRDSNESKKLQTLASQLNREVDAIWIYAETVFDFRHGVLAKEMPLPNREVWLTSAIQSRTGSLALYQLCCRSPTNCSLGMDLRSADETASTPLHERTSVSLTYQLFAVDRNNSRQMLRMLDITIPVASQGSVPESTLRIADGIPDEVLLKSRPENLTKVLHKLKSIDNISNDEHLSIGAKVDLAYKIVETGFFLLGTPWFSSLSSRNDLLLKTIDRSKRHSFILEVQTINLNDMLFDDYNALSETSQLFNIGVLLMDIALGNLKSSDKDDYTHETSIMSRLPLVEQNMGAQYCKATAFCLQHRKSKFQGPEKYEGPQFADWEHYLSEFLQDFYSQVFLRLEELRSIDTTSEFRSRKSWLTD